MTILRTNTIAGVGTTTFGPLLDGNLEFNSQNYIVLPKGSSTQEGVLRTTADVVGTGGTYYDNLVLAMPFNAATGLTDVSSRNRNPAAYGNVAISTAQSKYYGSSASFDGSGDYLKIPNIGNDLAFGTGDFTIEFWTYLNSTPDSHFYDGRDVANTDRPLIWIQNNLIKYYVSGSSVITGSSLNTNQWYHISVCRSGTSTKLFLNGSQTGSTYTDTINYLAPNSLSLCSNENGDARFIDGYIQDFRIYKGLAKYTANFTPPDRIAEIGVGFRAGQLRYNTDSNKVELYDGNQWTEVQSSRPDLNGGARGVFGSGTTPGNANVIDYINISSTGNAVTFGNLVSQIQGASASASSSTRGIWAGGQSPVGPHIQFITISSTGNSQTFGDLTQSRRFAGGVSNQTRGVFGGGSTPIIQNTIDYITIASTGNAQDFGDLTGTRMQANGLGSSTRGIFTGGNLQPTPGFTNILEYITISTLGNSTDFGDMTISDSDLGTCSNPIRGIMAGGSPAGNAKQNTIQFITIATLGNAVNFGSLVVGSSALGGVASPTRAVFAGGYTNPGTAMTNRIEYVTIMTAGNSVDFGDLTTARDQLTGCSNAHGGL